MHIDQLKNDWEIMERLIEGHLLGYWMNDCFELRLEDEFYISGGIHNLNITFDINSEYLFVDEKILTDLWESFSLERNEAKGICLNIIRRYWLRFQ